MHSSDESMTTISIRIDEDTKKRMEKMKDVNWSEVVRQAILKMLGQEEGRNLAKAVLLNERNVIIPDESYSSVEVIREWRNRVRWKK
jgi:Arc/MetJ-type ribon-helix-helix transcriptional regulator